MAARHSWVKVRLHCYICRTCGTCYENRQDRIGGWFRTWHAPDGSRFQRALTPPCERGPLTEKRLAHYRTAIEGAAADRAAAGAEATA